MSDKKVAAIVLVAGAGTRLQSTKPKVMYEVGGRPLIKQLFNVLQGLKLDRIVVVNQSLMRRNEEDSTKCRTIGNTEAGLMT